MLAVNIVFTANVIGGIKSGEWIEKFIEPKTKKLLKCQKLTKSKKMTKSKKL